jgi:hypothetical protein
VHLLLGQHFALLLQRDHLVVALLDEGVLGIQLSPPSQPLTKGRGALSAQRTWSLNDLYSSRSLRTVVISALSRTTSLSPAW